jgi:dienelactone hydrolase
MSDPVSRRRFISAAAALAACGSIRGWANGAADSALGDARHVPWLGEVQRPPERLPADAPALPSLLIDADGRPIESWSVWETRREQVRDAWAQFLQPLDLPRSVPKLEVLEEDHPAGCIRQLVRYESEPGIPVEGYLLLPERAEGRVPGVLAMHSTCDQTIRQPAGLEGEPEDFFGLRLARSGIVAFCPRCFLWQGEGTYLDHVAAFHKRHPRSLGMAKMLWDAIRGVDVLASLPQVDPDRLGAVGHSLGGKEGLYLAAFDERIKATVSSEGGIGTRFSNWEAPWYLGPAIKDERWTREHHELLALIAPRAFLLVGGDSADGDRSWPFIEAALPVYRLHDGDAPSALGLLNHRHGHSVPPLAQQRTEEWLEAYW